MANEEVVEPKAAAIGLATAERLIDRQVQMHQNVVDRSDGVTRLGIAELGGMAALAGFTLSRGLLDLTGGIIILGSAIVSAAGISASLRGGVGSSKRKMLWLGPDLGAMTDAIENGRSPAETHIMLLSTYRHLATRNAATIERSASWLVVSTYLIGASAAVFFAALIYILSRMIP